MQLKSKILNIESGDAYIIVLHPAIIKELSLSPSDRIRIKYNNRSLIVVIDVSKIITKNQIGIFEDVRKLLKIKNNKPVSIKPVETPFSLKSIRKKLNKQKLSRKEIYEIIHDICDNKLTKAEISGFVSAIHMQGLTLNETEYLIRAMAETGDMLKIKAKIVADKHCVGGVPGNRTSMIIVPIVAAAGIHIPKTSSRAITDPAGTADTMEVLAPVNFNISQIKRIVNQHKGCLVWGGAVHMAPVDDKIISDIEYPLRIDPTEMLLASILAKKYAVGANLVLIDIPYGKGTKCTKSRADLLGRKFVSLGKRLSMKIKIIKTKGSQPIGYGLGPALEAIDVMKVLKNSKDAPEDLKKKSLMMSDLIIKMAGKKASAKEILESGKALKKMNQIIKAQGGKINKTIKIGRFKKNILSKRSGKVKSINNSVIKEVARVLGAPHNKGAGLYLHKGIGSRVKRKEKLYTLYAESSRELKSALNFIKKNKIYKVK